MRDDLLPGRVHHVEQYANNRIDADHGRLKHWIRPMRGVRTGRSAQIVIAGLAFVRNQRRGHHKLKTERPYGLRVATVFSQPASAI